MRLAPLVVTAKPTVLYILVTSSSSFIKYDFQRTVPLIFRCYIDIVKKKNNMYTSLYSDVIKVCNDTGREYCLTLPVEIAKEVANDYINSKRKTGY